MSAISPRAVAPVLSIRQQALPPLCRRAGRVSVTLTRGQMDVLDGLVATGLFTSRADVLRHFIAKGASDWWKVISEETKKTD